MELNRMKLCVLLLTVSVCLANNHKDFLRNQQSTQESWKSIFNGILNEQPIKNKFGYVRQVEEEDEIDDLDSTLPYALPDPKEMQQQQPLVQPDNNFLEVRSIRSKLRFDRDHQSLCPSKRETVILNDSGYEYQPDRYVEVTCLHPYNNHLDYRRHVNKVCGEAGFHCIQLNRTIFLTRRRYDSKCWETYTQVVAAGCECMWPKHNFGEITLHH